MGLFDPKPKSDPNADLAAQLSTLATTVQQMQGQMGEITSAVRTMHADQTQMRESFGEMKGQFQPNDHQFQEVANTEQTRSLSEYAPEELEHLSEQQKYEIMQKGIMENMQQSIKEAISPLTDSIQGTQQNMARSQAESELQTVMSEMGADGATVRPDFNEILPTMVTMKKDTAYGNLPMKDLYDLAKGRFKTTNPDGYTAMQEKYFPKQENVQRPYGGLLSDTLQEPDNAGDMSIKDAAQDTMREYVETGGGLPGDDGAYAPL